MSGDARGNRPATIGFRLAAVAWGVRLSTVAIVVGLLMAIVLLPIPGASILGLLIAGVGLAARFLL